MIFIVGLIMFNIVLNGLKRVKHSPDSRFWTYDSPYSFTSQNITLRTGPDGEPVNVLGGNIGVFLAMWSAMTTIIFSLIGFETVSVTAGENKDLEKTETIKIATRKVSMRIILLYTLGCATGGLNVPYTDPNLRDYSINSIRSGEHSIFILGAVRQHLTFWPSFFNGFFIFSATTSGINSLYLSSRILHALAGIAAAWPDYPFFEKLRDKLQRTKRGVPYGAVFVSWLFGLLAYLATAREPSVVCFRALLCCVCR